MLQPNVDNNKDNTKITSLTDIDNSNETVTVSGVIFNQLPSPSNLSYHSQYQSQDSNKYKSITVSNQTECTEFKPIIPSKATTNTKNTFIPLSKAHNTSSYDVIFVPPQSVKTFSNSIPKSINKITSFTVKQHCSDVLMKICEILSNYTIDIEYNVNSNEYRINGVVFMTDHNSVFFMVSVFKTQDIDEDDDIDMINNESNIEFMRKSGDSISFSHFWCDIRDIFLNGNTTTKYGYNGVKRIENISNEGINDELNAFNDDLNENDEYIMDVMRVFINSKLGTIITPNDVLKHSKIMNTLIKETLFDCDIGIVRGVLIILISIIEKCQESDIINVLIEKNGLDLMKSIIYLLKSNSVLIQKYTVKLLSKLSAFYSFFDDKIMFKDELKSSYKEFEAKWCDTRNNKYYAFHQSKNIVEQMMFDEIRETLFK